MYNVITLKKYAKKMGIHYMTALNWWHANKIENAFSSPTGRIYVKDIPEMDYRYNNVYQNIPAYVYIKK